MAPDDFTSARTLSGVEQFGSADLLVAFGRKRREDQFALVVPEEETPFVFDEEGIGERAFVRRRDNIRFPQAIAGRSAKAAQFSGAADAVDVTILPHGRTHD